MTSSLVEKIASLKANFPQEESQSSNEAYILLASQLIHDSQSVHEVNRALLGAAVDKSSDVTQIAQPIQDYFFVLFEWYKTGVDTLKLPLLSHLPICLYIEFSNKRHPLGLSFSHKLCFHSLNVSISGGNSPLYLQL